MWKGKNPIIKTHKDDVKNVMLMRNRPSTTSIDLISRNQIRKKFSTSLKCGAHLIRYVLKNLLWLNLTLKIQN